MPVFQWSNDNLAEVELGILRRYETVAAMAQGLGVPLAVLHDSLDRWNAAVRAGEDKDFGRPPGSMLEIKTPPFYVGEIHPFITNTQGGPVHDSQQRVLNTFAEPIPRLYEAGELGSIWATSISAAPISPSASSPAASLAQMPQRRAGAICCDGICCKPHHDQRDPAVWMPVIPRFLDAQPRTSGNPPVLALTFVP